MKKITSKKQKIKKALKWIIVLVVLALIVFYFINKSKPSQAEPQFFTAQAAIGKVETSISGKGTLSPANQYEVKSLVKGELLEAPFEEGDNVKEGQLLYQISTSDISNSIKSAELSVDRAKLAYDDYVEKETDLNMYSKETGYIKKLYVKAGDTIQAGANIADIYSGDNMYIDLMFPAYEAKSAWVGKSADVMMETTGETVKGKVTSVSSLEEALDGGILARKVTISVKNKGGIAAGALAEAKVSGISSSNTGTFRAETQVTITAEASGKIEKLSVKEGQRIGKGDVLLSLSSKDIKRQLESADLSIKEAELTLDTQKNQMKQYTITAPISGKVITKNKKQGDTIDPTADAQAGPMAIIYDMSYLTFNMNIDELQISSIQVGQKVSIKTENFPKDTFEGIIEKISLKGITNNSVTSYPVTIKVADYKGLLPGMNVTGKVVLEVADQVLTVPSSALQRDNMVYVQSEGAVAEEGSGIPDGFKAVQVEVGINDGSSVEIKSGLKEGDTVYIPFATDMGMGMDGGTTVTVE